MALNPKYLYIIYIYTNFLFFSNCANTTHESTSMPHAWSVHWTIYTMVVAHQFPKKILHVAVLFQGEGEGEGKGTHNSKQFTLRSCLGGGVVTRGRVGYDDRSNLI
jgi:hypothetical protein